MKKLMFLLVLISLNISAFGQTDCPTPSAVHWHESNNISVPIDNAGRPIGAANNGNNGPFISTVNNPTEASTIFTTALWIGGIDPGGNLKQTYATYGNATGFRAGPAVAGLPDLESCENWDKIWVVTRDDIETHLADFNDNGVVDNPIAAIYNWPANGNPHFEDMEGFPLPSLDPTLAPYFDHDGNNIYSPEAGDYPLPNNISQSALPNEITYCMFNDSRLGGLPDHLDFQIGQTTYTYDCGGDNPLNNTVFVNYQMTNKALEDIDSLHVSLFVDFDLGCYTDDYIGCDVARNTFFAYNQDNVDGLATGGCEGNVADFGENPPVQAVTYLNKPLTSMTYYKNSGQASNPGTEDPNSPIEYYRYMTGSWRDGSPLQFGGDGYQEGTNPTNHAYPDDPNNPDGWSMASLNADAVDYRAIGSSKIGKVVPGQSFSWNMAFTYVREESLSNLENVTAMYDHIDQVQAAYDNGFAGSCMPTSTTNVAAADHNFNIFPNPTSDILLIKFPDFTLKTIRLIDVTGKVILEKNGQFLNETSLDLSPLSKGIYFLQMEDETRRFYEKISVQ